MKLTKSKLKEMIRKEMNEAKREIGGYYLMKQLKDLAQDAKRGGERKVHKALMYLHDRINQSYRDVDLNARDVQDIFNDPRGRKYSKDMTDWMVDSLFESDLPTTTKKDKTVTVVHKTSGKELVVTDTPSTRKKYKRIDYFVQADPRKIKKAIGIAKKMGDDMTGAVKKIERIEKDLSNNHEVVYALQTANESINEAKKKVPVEKLSVGNTYKDSRGYPVKIVDISTGGDMRGGGSSWKITYKDGYGKKKIIKTSLRKGVNLYESINEGKFNIRKVKTGSIIKYMQPGDRKIYKGKVLDIVSTRNEDFYVVKHKGEKINVEVSYIADLVKESMMFDDYHKLNRAYMDDFIKNYKKLNRKNVVKKKGDDIYGFRKGEREAHWKYDDNFKLHYDIDKAKALGLINFFNRAKKDHPWS